MGVANCVSRVTGYINRQFYQFKLVPRNLMSDDRDGNSKAMMKQSADKKAQGSKMKAGERRKMDEGRKRSEIGGQRSAIQNRSDLRHQISDFSHPSPERSGLPSSIDIS